MPEDSLPVAASLSRALVLTSPYAREGTVLWMDVNRVFATVGRGVGGREAATHILQ